MIEGPALYRWEYPYRSCSQVHITRCILNDDLTTRRTMETILAMEEEHADDLVSLLEVFGN
jgi:bacterioferritin (cytochrome b1)